MGITAAPVGSSRELVDVIKELRRSCTERTQKRRETESDELKSEFKHRKCGQDDHKHEAQG